MSQVGVRTALIQVSVTVCLCRASWSRTLMPRTRSDKIGGDICAACPRAGSWQEMQSRWLGKQGSEDPPPDPSLQRGDDVVLLDGKRHWKTAASAAAGDWRVPRHCERWGCGGRAGAQGQGHHDIEQLGGVGRSGQQSQDGQEGRRQCRNRRRLPRRRHSQRQLGRLLPAPTVRSSRSRA